MQALVSSVRPGGSDPFTGQCRCFRPSDRDAGWACWIVEGEWEGCGRLGKAIHLTVLVDIIQFLGISRGRRLAVPRDPAHPDVFGMYGYRNNVTLVHVRGFRMGFLRAMVDQCLVVEGDGGPGSCHVGCNAEAHQLSSA